MIKFYTAVGRCEIHRDDNGRQYPVVYHNGKELYLSVEEMILWASALWTIHTYDELEQIFYRKERDVHILGDADFADYLHRLELLGLLASGQDGTAEGALYRLLSNLYVVPVQDSFPAKALAFWRLWHKRKLPLCVAGKVFQKRRLTGMEKMILSLANQFRLSAAELIACVDSGHDYIPSEQALIRALYGGTAPQEIDLPMQAYCSKNRGNVTQAIAQLYLNREVMLQ